VAGLLPCPFCGEKPHLDRHDIFCDCGVKIEIPSYVSGKEGGKIWTGSRCRDNGVPQEMKQRWVKYL
jgi:hypothetical protein